MKLLFYIKILLFFSYISYGQVKVDQVKIESGPLLLNVDQPFTISVIIENSEERPSIIFPDFPELEKRSISVTSTMHSSGGKTVLVQKIVQEYYARQPGKLSLGEATIKVGDFTFKQAIKELTFVDVGQNAVTEDNLEVEPTDNQVIVDTEGNRDVFLSLSVNKSSVFVRQGFMVRLSLFVAKSSTVAMEFYRLDQQIQSILKQMRPITCWEENLNITEVLERERTINDKPYSEYTMYQAIYFPLSVTDVYFPALTLKMLMNGQHNEEKLVDFTSRPFTVKVKPLPPHPNKDLVAVGQFRLNETLDRDSLAIGESFRYNFSIQGEGNIAAISPPFSSLTSFDVYAPDVQQTIRRYNGNVTGDKTFSYMVVAKQNGVFPLSNFFNWIYFNPITATYDTLSSTKVIHVLGERKNQQNTGNGEFSIYSNLELKSTSDFYLDYRYLVRWLINIAVVLIFIAMIWIYVRK